MKSKAFVGEKASSDKGLFYVLLQRKKQILTADFSICVTFSEKRFNNFLNV